MKRVTLGAVLRECKRRGIKFGDDEKESLKRDLGTAIKKIVRLYREDVHRTEAWNGFARAKDELKKIDPKAAEKLNKYVFKMERQIENATIALLTFFNNELWKV